MTTSPPHREREGFDSQCSNKLISSRNSKWLQLNMTDIDTKVIEVVTLIKEDANSFNRKAEMHFRKRPMLIKLIEELYRAYRALAERYNYTNGELEWAHRAMKKTFSTQVLFGLVEDSLSSSSTNLYIEPDAVVTKEKIIQDFKKSLLTTCDEKEDIFLKYQNTVKILSNLEKDLNFYQMDSKGRSEQASEAISEVEGLKEAIAKVETDRDAAFFHQKELIRNIANLKLQTSKVQEEGHIDGDPRAEIRFKCLVSEVLRLETEKEKNFFQYKMCLEKIAELQRKSSLAENEAKLAHEKAYRAKTEEEKIRNDLGRLNKEKKSLAIEHDYCLQKESNLESELCCVQDESRRIRDEVSNKTEKMNSADDRYAELEISNFYLKSDVVNVELNIATIEKDLSKKHEELEKLIARLQEERLNCLKIEASTLALHNFQSEEENGVLEITEIVQILNEFDMSQDGSVREKNKSPLLEDLQSGVLNLKGMKEKLEEEVIVQKGKADSLEKHIYLLKEDIEDSKERYQHLKEKIKSLGLNPECVGSSLQALKDDNSKLRQIYEEIKEEKEALLTEFDNLEQVTKKSAGIEMLFQWLDKNKLALKSQLQTINNYVENPMEKNTILENSLYVADIEFESPKTKSQNSEELFEERSKLIVSLDSVENRLKRLEIKFSEAEKKCIIMEKEREPTLARVEDLNVFLELEKREHSSLETLSEARLATLEKNLHFLNQEINRSKIEFEEEVDRAVNAHFEIFILHITIQDLETKNGYLSSECEKHIELSKLRENLVSELEKENLEQQVEIEHLITEIEKLRENISRVSEALGYTPDIKIDNIIENIEGLKNTLLSYEDDRQKQFFENSILLELLGQVRVEGTEMMMDKNNINEKLENVMKQLVILQNDKHELMEVNKRLKLERKKKEKDEETFRAEIEKLSAHQMDLEIDQANLKQKHTKAFERNTYLMNNILDLKNEKQVLEQENNFVRGGIVVLSNNCTDLKNFATEKEDEIDFLSKELQNAEAVNIILEEEIGLLKKRMETEDMEKLSLTDSVKKMEKEIFEVKDLNNQLRDGISKEIKNICKKEIEVCLAEKKIKATEDLNSELRKNLDDMRRRIEETEIMKENVEKANVELFEGNRNQGEEIIIFSEVNGNLSLEIEEKKNSFEDLNNQFRDASSLETVVIFQKDVEFSLLEEEMKRKRDDIFELTEVNENQSEEIRFLRVKSKNLNLEVEEMKKECKVWEDEATMHRFDLQTSKAYEVVLENKVHEVFSLCKTLGNESGSKSFEMEKMKERVEVMDGDISFLKAELSSYGPAIELIRENKALLEHKVFGEPEIELDHNKKSKDAAEPSNQEKEHISAIPNRLQELLDLQTRIKSLEKFVTQGKRKVAMQKISSFDLEPSVEQENKPKEEIDPNSENLKEKRKNISSPLIEESESSFDKIEVPTVADEPNLVNNEINNERKIKYTEYNVQRSKNLEETVQDMKMKTKRNKKRKLMTVDLELMKRQLTEVDETLVHMKTSENPLNSDTMALAERRFQKTDNLHLEVKVMQNMFSKLDNQKETIGKIRFLKKTSIIVKSLFDIWRRGEHTRRKRKGIFRCCRPSSNSYVGGGR